jgi:acyl-CoA thioester hydrolase
LSTPPLTSRVRVRYSETDKAGIVYYANFFVWFEVARTDLLRAAGGSYRELEADGVMLPVIEAHCQYRRPALYDDEIDIRTTGSLLTQVRIRFDYEVHRAGEETALATGHTIHAAITGDGRPCRLPQSIRDILS